MSSKKLLGWKQLNARIPLSRTHIARKEKEGTFPKRIRVGSFSSSRVMWIEEEIDAFIDALTSRPS